MKKHYYLPFVALFLSASIFAFSDQAQQTLGSGNHSIVPAKAGGISTAPPVSVDSMIHSFSSKETQFRQALNQYAFTRDAVIQTIGLGGQVSGEYHRVSRFVFDDKGNRFEKIQFFPLPTLTEIQVTEEDLEDLSGVEPFALEASKIGLYNFNYAGKEHIDDLDLYVFDVTPKVMPSTKNPKDRVFQGRIWVDDRDLQIVKAKGKGVPEGKQRFPVFETYREQIDGKYWFPTYTSADDQLVFSNGQNVHVRMLVKYTDFERYHAKVTILDSDQIAPEQQNKSSQPAPKPPKTQP